MTTIHYIFRGSFWPPCRDQLTALNTQVTALKTAGIKAVAITAEPGGDDAVRDRLTERGVPKLEFEVKSDPEHKFLEKVPQVLIIIEDKEWEVSGKYKMIQPALVVYDEDGDIIPECTWSWKTMNISEELIWNTRVPTEEWSGPIKQVLLVTMRPVMSDLVKSVQDKRKVKLGSTHDGW